MDSTPEEFNGRIEDTNKLNKVKSIYSFWGRFPLLYSAQDPITFLGRAKVIRKRAIEKLHLQKGDRVLEVACGPGRNFPYLIEAIGEEGWLLGFDYTQEMLYSASQLCRRKGWKNIELVQGDAAELSIAEKDFDGVLSVLGISAIPGWERTLQRCKDILRLGGVLSVCDARLFRGILKFLNPLVRIVYSKLAAWDPSKNIPDKMKETFGNVDVENFNLGTFFIATSIKKGE